MMPTGIAMTDGEPDQDQRAHDRVGHAAARLADGLGHLREEVPVERREALLEDVEEDEEERNEGQDHGGAAENDDELEKSLAPRRSRFMPPPPRPAPERGVTALTLTSRLTLQIRKRESALMMSVITKSTRPISIERGQVEVVVRLGELVGDDAAIVYCGAKSDAGDLRVVADHHRHRHRLADGAAEARA